MNMKMFTNLMFFCCKSSGLLKKWTNLLGYVIFIAVSTNVIVGLYRHSKEKRKLKLNTKKKIFVNRLYRFCVLDCESQ